MTKARQKESVRVEGEEQRSTHHMIRMENWKYVYNIYHTRIIIMLTEQMIRES